MQRITTKAQFAAVMGGQTVSRTAHFALHRVALPPLAFIAPAAPASDSDSTPRKKPLFAVADSWLGVVVPKRWAKRAVTRNAIKRQIYSVSTDYESVLPVSAYVVRLRAGFDRKQFISATSDELKAAVRQELQQLFARVAARPTSPARPGGAP